jgi:hypothetical protein
MARWGVEAKAASASETAGGSARTSSRWTGAGRATGGSSGSHAGRQALLQRRQLGLDALGGRGGLGGFHLGLAALEHAFAHVVLERQRAHGELLDVLLHFFGGGDRRALHSGLGRGRRAGGGRGRCSDALDVLHALRSHGQHFHAFWAGFGGQHHCIVAELLPHQDQGIARCFRAESFDVQAVLPMVAAMRFGSWLSASSVWLAAGVQCTDE